MLIFSGQNFCSTQYFYFALNNGFQKVKRFEIIHELHKNYPITWLVTIAGVSRSGYYKWRDTEKVRRKRYQYEQLLKKHLMAIHHTRPFYGCPRLQVALKKEGFHINHKRVYRLMKELNIRSVIRKKRRFFGRKASIIQPNRLNRVFKTNKPNHLYVTDITYLAFGDRFFYLSAIQDLFNNEIVAWELSKRNDLKLVSDTVKKTGYNKRSTRSNPSFRPRFPVHI
ncbi:IS3 family transposase [Bacillus cereus]